MGFDPETLGRLSSLVSQWSGKERTTPWKILFCMQVSTSSTPTSTSSSSLCMRIQDLPRHLGQHSGGMVICQGQLDHVVPLNDPPCLDAPWCSGIRKTALTWAIIKVDLLGPGNDGSHPDCLQLVSEHMMNPWIWPNYPGSGGIRNLAASRYGGHVSGGEPGQWLLCLAIKPDKFYDLVVQVAIYPAGPDRRQR